jgi:hypothetical protein
VFHRINKAVPSIWLTPSTLAIGLGAKQIQLPEVSLEEQKMITALYSGIVAGQLDVIEQSIGVTKAETAKLLEKLQPVLEQDQPTSRGSWVELGFAEMARASLDYQVNGEMVLAERWHRVIHIDQIDKTGLLLAKALLASGVGKIISHDDGVILNTDLGELGFPANSLGKNRVQVANQILAELSLVSDSRPRLICANEIKPNQRISFAITVGHLAFNPRTYSRWLSRDVRHLGICFNSENTLISPLIIPGETACLNCFQEHLVDEDENWPIIASQLLGLPRFRDDASALTTAVGLATRTILRDLDEQAGFKFKATDSEEYLEGYLLEYSTGNVQRLRFNKHELCLCLEIT